MTLGEAIRQLRRDKGMLQRQLADAVGIPPSVISSLETGARQHIGAPMVARISKAMGLSADEEARLQALRQSRRGPQLLEIPPTATAEEVYALRVLVASIGHMPALQLIALGQAVEQWMRQDAGRKSCLPGEAAM